MKKTLNCRGQILDLSTPAIMGILNLTPDSFYDGGTLKNSNDVLMLAEKMLEGGADIIDIGGQSTRPGSKKISVDEEWERIYPALKELRTKLPKAIISVDTFYADVAQKAIEAGASIINDISGGADPEMFKTIGLYNVPYVLMHIQGTPETMQKEPHYDDVVSEVLQYFADKIGKLKEHFVKDIILDPGFGFGKNNDHNYSLLKHLAAFNLLGYPLLAGLSRKSLVTKVLNVKSAEALNGTTALNTITLLNGASILRVHDVYEAAEVRKLILQYKNAK